MISSEGGICEVLDDCKVNPRLRAYESYGLIKTPHTP
jgi:hypothetical protein